jgi:outer membrane protein OmpA-like peptidoglycan-associated protein
VSDSDKKPKLPPPDDFSKTTPNISLPDDDDGGGGWDKTNHNIPSQTPADDWGKTVINYDVSRLDDDDDDDDDPGDSSHYSNNSPKQPDWGMTQANINLDSDFEANDKNDFGEDEASYGATVPYFRLPEAERDKYQNLPPTPAEKVRQEEQEKREKGGIPTWFWISAGLMMLFSFALLVLLGIGYYFSINRGFDVVVTGAPSESRFIVDGKEWGVPSTGNQHKLYGLESGSRKIQVVHPKFQCEVKEIKGEDGQTVEYTAAPDCKPTSRPDVSDADCEKTLNEDTREACAEEILDGLANPPDLERLLKALKLLRINFAKDSAAIPERNKRILTKASVHIKNLPPQVVIEVGGHTDSDGSDEYNQKLSEKRAKAVKDFFISLGINETRLTSQGYGEKVKVADNDTEEGKARNRRIDYKPIQK